MSPVPFTSIDSNYTNHLLIIIDVVIGYKLCQHISFHLPDHVLTSSLAYHAPIFDLRNGVL